MFLEERIADQFVFGSSVSEAFAVYITQTTDGSEYRSLLRPYPTLSFGLNFPNKSEPWMNDHIVGLYRRSGGGFGGFRLKNPTDYSTNDRKNIPNADDQQAILISAGVYQAVVWYGPQGQGDSVRRRIRKPVDGSMVVAIVDTASFAHPVTQGATVDYTSGLITFDANNQKAITSISKAGQAVIGVGGSHGYTVGGLVYISAVVGMTQINSLRARVVGTSATTITVDIDSQGFSDYTSGGLVDTRPQTGELVTCGCEFDIPVRFETILDYQFSSRNSSWLILSTDIRLIELLNP